MRRVLLVLGAALVALFALSGCGPQTSVVAAEGDPSASAEPTQCPEGSWAVKQANPGELSRWTAGGIPSIAKADSTEEAKKAIAKWLKVVKADPDLLSGTILVVYDKEVPASKLASDGCMTPKGVKYAIMLEGSMATADVTPGEAPSNGVNTGVNADGAVVASATAGITGNRKAVKVVFDDGSVIWVMSRCGNIVTITRPALPTGPTDQPPPTTPSNPDQPNPTPGETPSEKPCVKPAKPGDGNYTYNPETCVWKKVGQTFDEQQNGDTGVRQDPQDNTTSGVDTGATIDTSTGEAIKEPAVQDPAPVDNRATGDKAPDPTANGSNSGAVDGSGTPSGTTTDSGGTTVGGTVTNDANDDQADAAGDDNSGMPVSP